MLNTLKLTHDWDIDENPLDFRVFQDKPMWDTHLIITFYLQLGTSIMFLRFWQDHDVLKYSSIKFPLQSKYHDWSVANQLRSYTMLYWCGQWVRPAFVIPWQKKMQTQFVGPSKPYESSWYKPANAAIKTWNDQFAWQTHHSHLFTTSIPLLHLDRVADNYYDC